MIWNEVKPSYQPTRSRNFPPTAATAGILRVFQIRAPRLLVYKNDSYMQKLLFKYFDHFF